MRDLEHGKSMPSGDAAACALFSGFYLYVFDFPYMMIFILPLVSLGRVYVHCHWIADTIAGSILGNVFAAILFRGNNF